MRHYIRSIPAVTALVLAPLLTATACSSAMSRKERGAIVGAATGAAAGGLIGRANGSTAKGAIIGAAVGGAAGAIIGHQMDQQAKELEQNIPNARVERVGEGIQVTFESGLLYDFDSDRVRAASADNLRELARSLVHYPNSDLLIVGHTDDVGTDSYNQRLSERRAVAAADYPGGQGVARTRVRTRGLGEEEPVAPNDGETGRQRNRRVEVAIYANEAAREAAKSRAPGL